MKTIQRIIPEWLFALVLTVIFSGASLNLAAEITSQGEVRTDSIKSEILNVTRKYSVYLPESYSAQTQRKYPVLYLLHGLGDNHKGWVSAGHLQDIAGQSVLAGRSTEMIVIVPDASKPKDGYFNVEDWPYETFFFDEFIPYIEKTYRIIGDQAHRAVAGYSMGGGGATAYALKHPDMFSSVFAMSALMTLPNQGRAPERNPKMEEFGRSVLANDCIILVAYSDQQTLEKLREIRWFLDCGDDDFLLEVNYDFYREMQKAKIPCQLRVRDGDHTMEYWRVSLDMALSFVSVGFVNQGNLYQGKE